MKPVFVLLVAVVLVSGCTRKQDQVVSSVETASINVPTAICRSCAKTLTRALQSVDGVETAEFNLDKKIATVTFLRAKASIYQLEQAVANAGYDANNTKRNPEAYEKLDSCCKIDK